MQMPSPWAGARLFATLLFGLAFSPVVGQWFVKLAEQRGAYDDPAAQIAGLSSMLTPLATDPHYLALVAFLGGIALGMWLDTIFRRWGRKGALQSNYDGLTNSERRALPNFLLDDFAAAFRLNPSLGRALDKIKVNSVLYYAAYQHSTVIWSKDIHRLYCIPTLGTILQINDVNNPDDVSLFSDARMSDEFNVPEGQLPPHGGVARLWRQNRVQWEWMGWRLWHYVYLGDTYHQTFEKGTIFGALPVSQGGNACATITILDNGVWRLHDAKAARPRSLLPEDHH